MEDAQPKPMNPLRIIGGLLSFVLAALLAFHVAYYAGLLPYVFQPHLVDTYYVIVHVNFFGLSLSGWQIAAFVLLELVLAVGFARCGMWAFKGKL